MFFVTRAQKKFNRFRSNLINSVQRRAKIFTTFILHCFRRETGVCADPFENEVKVENAKLMVTRMITRSLVNTAYTVY